MMIWEVSDYKKKEAQCGVAWEDEEEEHEDA